MLSLLLFLYWTIFIEKLWNTWGSSFFLPIYQKCFLVFSTTQFIRNSNQSYAETKGVGLSLAAFRFCNNMQFQPASSTRHQGCHRLWSITLFTKCMWTSTKVELLCAGTFYRSAAIYEGFVLQCFVMKSSTYRVEGEFPNICKSIILDS